MSPSQVIPRSSFINAGEFDFDTIYKKEGVIKVTGQDIEPELEKLQKNYELDDSVLHDMRRAISAYKLPDEKELNKLVLIHWNRAAEKHISGDIYGLNYKTILLLDSSVKSGIMIHVEHHEDI